MFKEQKGITLVALVITIIVLLILAGVSISLVVGEGGVLGRAKNAVSDNEAATVKQEIQLAIADAQIAYFDAWSNNQVTVDRKSFFITDPTTGKNIYYENNCPGANSVKAEIKDSTDAPKEVTVTYISKTEKTYTATFDYESPSNTLKFESGF